MILIFMLLNQVTDFEDLYYRATILEVQFKAEKDSAFATLVELAQDTLYADTTINFLISKFDTKFGRERHALKDIFKEIGTPTIKHIVEKLDYRGSDEEARSLKQSLWVLGEIGGDDFVEPAARFISDTLWQVRSASFTTLGKTKSRDALPYILQGLNDSISAVRKSAYYALSQIALDKEVFYLLQGLDDAFYGVRYAAVKGLLNIGEAVSEVLLKEVGEDPVKDFFIFTVFSQLTLQEDTLLHFIEKTEPPIRLLLYEGCSNDSLLRSYLEFETNDFLKNFLIEKTNHVPE